MCAFWLNTYRFEKYEHFWASSLLKFDEFYENVNNAECPKENVLLLLDHVMSCQSRAVR